MELGRFFSLRDFFNYYIAGTVWFVDAYFLFSISLSDLLKSIWWEQPIPILFGICIVIFPYIVGFAFSRIGKWLSEKLYGCFGGDPLDWVFDYENKNHKGEKLTCEIRRRCSEFIDRLFKIEAFEKNPKRYFYLIQTCIRNQAGTLNSHAERLQDLETLAASLLIPLPLLSALVVDFILLSQVENFCFIRAVGCLMVFSGVFCLIMTRHLKLREYWVKHIYRSFVVLSITKPHAD